ncbi:Ankyrin-3 [Nymphon striatum]|nr:Ankyrin-3 [Nymphon striatum]
MGGVISNFFQNGSRLFFNQTSKQTQELVLTALDALESECNPNDIIKNVLSQCPEGENILAVTGDDRYNILQKAVGWNSIELVRWLLNRGCDVNRGPCSLPLHIATFCGFEPIVNLLLKYGAKVDAAARMCFPGPHNTNCELSFNNCNGVADHFSDRLQSAEYYAIDGDRARVLALLLNQGEENWLPCFQKRPLLHLACERGAWECVKHLINVRSEEINLCHDEYYPIHQAALQDIKFLELLIKSGADAPVRTACQQMTVLHVVFLLGKKSADETMATIKMLLDNGLREMINEPDSLGNTPLHALIVRYALEESRYGYNENPQPWNKWDMLHMVRFLLQNGCSPSINRCGNTALACVLRHVKDWEFRYELLDMLLQQGGGDPNVVGRDGSVPLMVCLVPLINKDPLHYLTHTKKVFFLNCVRLLCKYGANPNCHSRSNLTPLHVLVFTASELITINGEDEKRDAFSFITQLFVTLLQHGLDPNVRFSQRTEHTLLSLMDMVQNARVPSDLDLVYNLTITLIQYGANPDVSISPAEPMLQCNPSTKIFIKKSSNQVLYYYIQLILRKEELLEGASEHSFSKLIWLYYYSMDHVSLYHCLKILHAQTKIIPTRYSLYNLIHRLYSTPRTLKQIARVSIYSSLNKRPALYVNKLPLPTLLKEYLLHWTP